MLDWRQLDHVVEAGRIAARDALESSPGWLTGSSEPPELPGGSGRRFRSASRSSWAAVQR